MSTRDLKATYDDQGYVLVNDLVPLDLLSTLRAACDRVVTKTRTGAWSHRRTVGKQFPPFDTSADDTWGVQHIMHPLLGEPAFAAWYTSERVRVVAGTLLGCEDGALQMELFNLLINPLEHDFALRWHRDGIREDATAEEERQALASSTFGVQWNTALYEDACLYLVPGSHKVPRTDGQRAHSTTLLPPTDPLAMPGSIQLTLQRKFSSLPLVSLSAMLTLARPAAAGETVFYNSDVLHCATYDHTRCRATLHACMGDTRGGSKRARNVLQHGLEWMGEPAFRDTLDERGREMLDALMRMKEDVQGDVGYSLSG